MINKRAANISVKMLCKSCGKQPSMNLGEIGALFSDFKEYVNNKFLAFESKIVDISNRQLGPALFENVITEAVERIKRLNNLMVFQLPKSTAATEAQQICDDRDSVNNIIATLAVPSASIVKVHRLCSRQTNCIRPVKIVFASPHTVEACIRNKILLRASKFNTIPLAHDQTPTQAKYLHSVRSDLSSRVNNGEPNLTIKYIKGIPTIVTSNDRISNSNLN